METLGDESQQQSKESSGPPVSKLLKLKISLEKTGTVSDGDDLDKKNRTGVPNHRVLRFSSRDVTVSLSAKTPKPPAIPKSRAFHQKSQRLLDKDNRLGGDGEACEEVIEEEVIDYCAIERLPGDGCFSESADDYELSNLSDGYDEEDFEENILEDLESDINEEIFEEELSQPSNSGDSQPSTTNSSRASSAQISGHLHREKQGRTLSAKRHSSAGSNLSQFGPSKTPRAVSRKGCWTAVGTNDIRPALTASLFPNVTSTIHFTVEGERVHSLPSQIRKLLKWKMSTITPNVIKLCIARSGFRPTKKNDWIGYWGKHMKAVAFKSIRDFQKVNHFPGTFQIGRKDRLWKNLSKLQARHGKKEFGFIPQTFVMPHDFRNFKRVWEEGGNKQKWILKPPASARGIGIRVVHKWNQIPRKRPVVVQRYLSKPFLINGKKFDLRIYVFVSSFDPLRIYVFEEGLTRFATCKYSSSSKSLNNKFIHLTNYSINKKNEDAYIPNNGEDACQGHKWSLKALWGYLKRMGVNTARIWENIKDIVVKTIISCESTINLLIKQNVRNSYCCHELFGFDIMLDENLKPWLLEVNISPSLHSTSPLDMSIKGQMVRDLLNISGFRIPENVGGVLSMASFSSGNTPDNGRASLSSDQKAKHGFYANRHNDERIKATILDILTPEDIRVLIETEDEYSRRGCFQRVFPSENSLKYLRLFEATRYRNILLDEWIKKYLREGRGIALGVALLCSNTLQGIHLRPFSSDPTHQWVSPQLVTCSHIVMSSAVSRSLSAPAASRRSEERISASQVSLPRIKRKIARHHLVPKRMAPTATLSLKTRPATKTFTKNT